jgi:tight adherence protein B
MLATPFVALVSVYIAGPVGLLLSPVPFAINTTLRKRQTRIRSEFVTTELAPALQLIIGQLRIGRNIVGAISEVAGSIPSPLGDLLNEAVANARLGTPIDIDLMRIAREEHNPHLEIVASAIGVQAKLGGSLTDILQTVVEDIEEEDRLRRDIRSLTADGRMSAQILLAMPPAMLIFVSIMSPGYAGPLISDPLGRIMSAAALCLAIVGVQWLRVLSTEQAKY